MRTLHLDKIASVTANCSLRHDVKVSRELRAEAGSVLAVEVLERKSIYNQLELSSGRMAELRAGDRIAGCLGHRRALGGFAGTVPDRLAVDDEVDLLNLGGVLGHCSAPHPELGRPIRCKVLGQVLEFPHLGERIGHPASIKSRALATTDRLDTAGIPVVAVVGTAMNSGKTAACHVLVQELVRRGKTVAAGKATGVSLRRDLLEMEDAGARDTLTFTDFGYPATDPGTAPLIARSLLTALARRGPDVIVLELGDGLFGDYGVDSILGCHDIRQSLGALLLTANDPVGAWGAQETLRSHYGLEVTAVAGPATDNQVGVDAVRQRCSVPAHNARTSPESLALEVLNALANGVAA